jgi:hypothetical protein
MREGFGDLFQKLGGRFFHKLHFILANQPLHVPAA